MPCSDGLDSNVRYVEVEKGTQTSRLCAVFSVLERRGLLKEVLDQCDGNEAGVSRASTVSWWERHKEADVARRQREAREREVARKREQAREKVKKALTREELKLLGIKE